MSTIPISSMMVDEKCKAGDSIDIKKSSCKSIEFRILLTAELLPQELWPNL